MMNNLPTIIGHIVLIVGGTICGIGVLGFLGFISCCAWIAFSESFRDICKAEKLIFEYRKNREEFIRWKNHKKVGIDAFCSDCVKCADSEINYCLNCGRKLVNEYGN